MSKARLDKLKGDVYKANMDLVKSNLVTGTFGNVSGIDRDSKIVAIKPSGVDYNELSPKEIAATTNPIKRLPESPIKILAGKKLYFKKPIQLPIKATAAKFT